VKIDRRKTIPQSTRDLVVALLDRGEPPKAVAAETGLPLGTVYRILHKEGFAPVAYYSRKHKQHAP
jgi:hypothetical protein